MIDPDKHLATYGDWDPLVFFALASQENRTVACVAARCAAGSSSDNVQIGSVIRRIWDSLIAALPGIVGHRLSWSEIVFFAPTATVENVVRAILSVSSPQESDVHVRVAVQLAPSDPAARASFCDALGSGLAKIEYRNTYPDAWCIFDGVVVHAPS